MKTLATLSLSFSLLLGGTLYAGADNLPSRAEAQQTLQQQGISPAEYNKRIFAAAFCGDIQTLQLLVAAGADVNTHMESEGNVPKLFEPFKYAMDDFPGAQYFSSMCSIKGATPLMFSSLAGQKDAVRLLLSAGADPNGRSENGATALTYTAFNTFLHNCSVAVDAPTTIPAQSAQIAELLIEKGADVKARTIDGATPLHFAALYGDPELASTLVKLGANPNIKDLGGTTPVSYASLLNLGKMLELFIAASDMPSEVTDPITELFANTAGANSTVLATLLQAGGDPNNKDQSGLAPLHYAALTGNVKGITLLIVAGAEVNVQDNDGMTPLHYAASIGSREAVSALMQAGADITIRDNEGQSAADLLED